MVPGEDDMKVTRTVHLKDRCWRAKGVESLYAPHEQRTKYEPGKYRVEYVIGKKPGGGGWVQFQSDDSYHVRVGKVRFCRQGWREVFGTSRTLPSAWVRFHFTPKETA